MDFLSKAGLIQWALSGALLAAGFIFSILWPLGILGAAYFIFLAQRATTRKAVCGGLLAWTIKSLAALLWFLSVYPIEWLEFSLGKTQLLVVIFYWVSNSLWLGVGGVFVALAIKNIYKITSKKLLLGLSIPTVWIVGELLGSLSFSVMTYGTGGAITSAFSFGYLGYLLAQHEWLIQLARIYGVYGLSFGAVALSLIGLWSVQSLRQKNTYLLLLAFLLFWGSAYIPIPFWDKTPTTTDYYSVLIIDTNFPVSHVRTAESEQEIRSQLEAAVQSALAEQSDYIILPEDSRYFNQFSPPEQEKNKFKFTQGDPETIIVDSGRTTVTGETVLQSFIYNGLQDTVDSSHKRYLVPQGEFMPYFYSTILKILGYADAIEMIEKDIDYTVGPQVGQDEAAVSTPGVLFCFESISPWGVQKIMKERGTVPFVAHPISHGWFNEPTQLWQSLDSMLRVQALWSGQYIVSAGGHVAGQVFTPQGEIQNPKDIQSGENWIVRQAFIPAAH